MRRGLQGGDLVVAHGDHHSVAALDLVQRAALTVPVDGGQVGEIQFKGHYAVIGGLDRQGSGGTVGDALNDALGGGGARIGVQQRHHIPAGELKGGEGVPLQLLECDVLAIEADGCLGGDVVGGGFAGTQVGQGDVVLILSVGKALDGALDVIGYGVHRHADQLVGLVVGYPQAHVVALIAVGHGAHHAVDGDARPGGQGVAPGFAVKGRHLEPLAAGAVFHLHQYALLGAGSAGELHRVQMAHGVHIAGGRGVSGLGIQQGVVAGGLAHLHLGKAVDIQPFGSAVDRHGQAVLLHAGDGAGIGGDRAAQAHGLGSTLPVQVHPGVTAHLQGIGGGEHVILVDLRVGGQGDAAGAADHAGQGQQGNAAAAGRHGGDGAAHPVIVGVAGQLGIDAPLVHKVDGPAEHGGHLGPGQGVLWQKAVELVALDDAVHVQQVYIGLQGGGNRGSVRKAHGVGGQALGQGGELHGPHQIHGQRLTGDGLHQPARAAQGPQLGLRDDAGLQADGHLLGRPGVHLLGQDLLQLVLPVLGDGLLVNGVHAGGTGAKQQRFTGGHLLVWSKGGGAGPLDHPLGGQVLHIVLGPVIGHVGKADGRCGHHQQGERHQRGQRQRENSLSFHM